MTERNKEKKEACGQKMEVFSRVVGYYRPVENWNKGKQDEFKSRKTFAVSTKCAQPTLGK